MNYLLSILFGVLLIPLNNTLKYQSLTDEKLKTTLHATINENKISVANKIKNSNNNWNAKAIWQSKNSNITGYLFASNSLLLFSSFLVLI